MSKELNPTKIFFGKNIRFLRERKKLSQEALAERLSLTRSKLNALENGQTKSPPPEDFITFSNYFKISIDSLLKVNLSTLSELTLRELEAGNDVYMTGSNMRILAITVDQDNRENIEYVPIKAKAGYVAGYNDPEFIASLPKYKLPNLPEGGTYRIFPTIGDSMLPVPEGSDVVGQYVEDWKSLRADTPCIVILKADQDFVFKRVTIQKEGSLLLKSFNALYEPYEVPAESVLELWKYHSFHSRELPISETTMDQLMKAVRDVQKDVKELKENR